MPSIDRLRNELGQRPQSARLRYNLRDTVWLFGKTRKHKCPDGSVRHVFKNPEDAFPLHTTNSSRKFGATAKTLEDLQGGNVELSAGVRKQVAGLLVELDRANRSLLADFRATYVVYSSNPCGLDKYLETRIDRIMRSENQLRQMEMETDRLNTLLDRPDWTENQLGTLLESVLTRLQKPLDQLPVGRTLVQIRSNTKEWGRPL
jgi:hypothetical protein